MDINKANVSDTPSKKTIDTREMYDRIKGIPAGRGMEIPIIADRNFNIAIDNDENPDPDIPAGIFNFDLILSNRRFKVCLDTLIRIQTEEDLSMFSDDALNKALEVSSQYRMTCFCAYIAAKKTRIDWELYHKRWLAERSSSARNALKMERIKEKNEGMRKEIGQITSQEVEEYILNNYGETYEKNVKKVGEWEAHEEIFKELEEVLDKRANHLQTLINSQKQKITKPTT